MLDGRRGIGYTIILDTYGVNPGVVPSWENHRIVVIAESIILRINFLPEF